MKTEVIHNEDGHAIIHVNKQTHKLRIENDTEEGADVIIERIEPFQKIELDLSKPVHKIPTGEDGQHDLSENCGCWPELEQHGNYQVCVHNIMPCFDIVD